MSIFRIAVAALLPVLAGVGCAHAGRSPQIRLVGQDSGVEVRLRGVSAASARVAWASGTEGTVLRTVDGGDHWQVIEVPGAAELDFRDVEGFDAQRAVVLSIGPGAASRVYRTEDGGQSWALALQNRDPDVFLDCMAFEGAHGVILGDPVEGRFQIRETFDHGKHWVLRTDGPIADAGEAAFAASGTCIALSEGNIVLATGGTQARVHYLLDPAHGESGHWRTTPAAEATPLPSAGYFSIAPAPNGFVAVGGDYERPQAGGLLATLAMGHPPGSTVAKLGLESQPGPSGYRSGVACTDDATACIATGPSGTDRWDGATWTAVSPLGFDAIDFAGRTGWVSGEGGRIARIEIAPAESATMDVVPAEAAQVGPAHSD